MPSFNSIISQLGHLRLGLLGLAVINTFAAAVINGVMTSAKGIDGIQLFSGLIAPVLAPLFAVVIFFDFVMSRVRAADAEGDTRERFRNIARLELIVIVLTLLYWIPYLSSLT